MAISTPFKQPCPSCDAPVPIKDAAMIGKKVECPKCKYRFVVEEPTDKTKKASGDKSKATAITAKGKAALSKKPVEEEFEDEDLEAEEDEASARSKTNGKAKSPAKPVKDEDKDEEEAEEKPRGKAKGKSEDEDEEEEESGKSKKKKKKKKSAGAGMDKKKLGLILAGVGVVLLAVVGGIVLMGGGGGGGGKKTPNTKGGGGGGGGDQANKDKKGDPDKVNPNPKPDGSGKQGGSVTSTVRLTNLLPKNAESVQHFFFKNYLETAAGRAAVDAGVLDDGEFRRRLGFAPSTIDAIIRAESFKSFGDWTFTVLHTTEPVNDLRPLETAMDLKGEDRKAGQFAYYKVGKNGAYAEGISRLALGVPAFLRSSSANFADAAKAQPLCFRLHDKHTLIFAHENGMKQFLKESREAAPAPKKAIDKDKDKTETKGETKGKGKGFPGKDKKGKKIEKPEPKPEVPPQEGDKKEPEPVVETAYSGLANQHLAGMLRRMSRVDEGEVPIVASAIDMVAINSLIPKQGTLQPRLGWQLRAIWDLTATLDGNGNRIVVLGTAVKQRDDLFVYSNDLECPSEGTAKALLAELKEQRAPEVAQLYGKLLGNFPIDLPQEPVEKKEEGPPGVKPPPVGPKGKRPLPGEKEETKENKEVPKNPSHITVTLQDGNTVEFTLTLLLNEDAQRRHAGPAFLVLLYGLKTDLALADAVDRYRQLIASGKTPAESNILVHRLAIGGKKLGVNDLLVDSRKKDTYGPGAFPRTGPRYAREPLHRISWMAGLLPYMGHGSLYQKIDFSRSWKDPENWLMAQTVIPEFIDPGYPVASRYHNYPGMPLGTATTHFVGLAGIGPDIAEAAYGDPATQLKLGVFGNNRITPLKDMVRGTSNTILMVRVPHDGMPGATPWLAGGGSTVRTVPETNSLQPFLTKENNGEGTYILMADGSVRYVKVSADKEVRARQDELFRKLATVKEPQGDLNADELGKVVPTPREATLTPPPKEVAKKDPPKTSTTEGWKTFTSKDEGFSVSMPGAPRIMSGDKAPEEMGLGGGQATTFLSPPPDATKVGVMIMAVQLSPDKAALKANDLFDLVKTKVNAKAPPEAAMKEEKILTLGKHPGREWQAKEKGKLVAVMRTYLGNGRLYLLLMTGPNIANATQERALFFNSFKLQEAAPVKQGQKDPPKTGQAPAGWKQFSSPKGDFSVMMPGIPKDIDASTVVKDPKAAKAKTYMAIDQDKVYIVGSVLEPGDLSKTPLNQAYVNFKQGMLNSMGKGAKILKESKVNLQGKYEGREYQIEVGGKTVYARVFIVGQQFYTLMAIAAPQADAQVFFNSFKLLK